MAHVPIKIASTKDFEETLVNTLAHVASFSENQDLDVEVFTANTAVALKDALSQWLQANPTYRIHTITTSVAAKGDLSAFSYFCLFLYKV